jgi:hypothetical protein
MIIIYNNNNNNGFSQGNDLLIWRVALGMSSQVVVVVVVLLIIIITMYILGTEGCFPCNSGSVLDRFCCSLFQMLWRETHS